MKDIFFVLKTSKLPWLCAHFVPIQEGLVELVCFYSTYNEQVFIIHQNMSPYLVSFCGVLQNKSSTYLLIGESWWCQKKDDKKTQKDKKKNMILTNYLFFHLSATWMTWRGSASQTTSQLSRMCCAHVWRPLALWKLTSPSKISTSSQYSCNLSIHKGPQVGGLRHKNNLLSFTGSWCQSWFTVLVSMYCRCSHFRLHSDYQLGPGPSTGVNKRTTQFC